MNNFYLLKNTKKTGRLLISKLISNYSKENYLNALQLNEINSSA